MHISKEDFQLKRCHKYKKTFITIINGFASETMYGTSMSFSIERGACLYTYNV